MLIGRSILRDMAAFIEERKMSRKKNNRLSLEQHKRTYRENQAAIAKALEQNAELEKAIIEEENLEIVGIIRKYRVGIDNLEQIMQGIQPKGESLFSEEKENTEGFTLPVFSAKPRKRAEKKSETKLDEEGIEHEED